MSNKKLILGIAAGAAALAVVGIILKRKGYLDNLSERADEIGSSLKDKFGTIKESARKKFDDAVHKGEEIADKLSHHTQESTQTAATAATDSKGRGAALQNGINPATA